MFEAESNGNISIEEFKKVDIRVGEIRSAERVPETDKLLKLSVDLGEGEPRQIVSGIATYFPNPDELTGKHCLFAANLEPRVIKGLESNGMIIALSSGEKFALVVPEGDIPPGTRIS